VGSYLDARARGGEWLVRLEDVDRGRERPGAADDILATLERFGLEWDGPVLRQHTRWGAYETALHALAAAGRTYPCSCTRADLAPTDEGAEARYPGYCRTAPRRARGPHAIRFRTEGEAPVTIRDGLQPPLTQCVETTVGDFVLRRRDGFYAYQLAVVVDDAAQGVTDVVRGLDLYDNTPRQRLLQTALGLPVPRYLHLPLVVDGHGAKHSKSRGALPPDPAATPRVLTQILYWLRHPPPSVLRNGPPKAQLEWAVNAWKPSVLHGLSNIINPP
jgi:glutamyl-Q tRNA(Asp) synthetase